ncbi:GLUG motif-containing protein [Bacteroides helcogenes]|uniref:Fibronectin type III domain protein n=1 Tax=Bacteroides helcogenes (strain ATCC 35417 / DSM 20613 / JCM 6297 / CCUG 15421 / P 36-108) TaxID=693979 RepID=E6SUG8_BACT6|nr:GLUG motif-containing protein [Bacteroides helcogenes]ADV42386.1 Fibronectin type III domain protein [Bacteroides helcogenes P 36-108]MDY5237158.1 GLUG motif-containing protein [Bacteroides helcogenes]
MHNKLLLLAGSLMLLCFSGCSKDSAPDNEMPILATGGATDIFRIGATLSGTLQKKDGAMVKDYGILISELQSMVEYTELKASSTENSFKVLAQGLKPGTKYYYCAYANSGYSIGRGEIKEFTTTESNVPVFGELSLDGKDEKSFTVSTTILDEGGSELSLSGFCWKLFKNDSDVPTVKDDVCNASMQDGVLSMRFKDLIPDKDYLVRAYGINAKGVGYSKMMVVSTNNTNLPTISSIALLDSTAVSLNVKASILSMGESEITEMGFCWSTKTEEPTTNDMKYNAIDQKEQPFFTHLIYGLLPETTYYIRAYAVNSRGIGYGDTYQFVTKERSEPGIYTLADLLDFRDRVNNGGSLALYMNEDKVINLYSDIDLESIENWEPIKHIESGYTFDGHGHVLTNLKITEYRQEWSYYGYGFINQNWGTVKDLHIGEGSRIAYTLYESSKMPVTDMGVIGTMRTPFGRPLAKVINCTSAATIKIISDSGFDHLNIGGIVGQNGASVIQGCSNTGTIDCTSKSAAIGGICGSNYDKGEILGCTNWGAIGKGYECWNLGGIVGSAPHGSIQQCVNMGQLNGGPANACGGICGNATYTSNSGAKEVVTINQCRNEGEILNGKTNVGGIAGYADACVTNCRNIGNIISSAVSIGSICGEAEHENTFTGNINEGTVNGATGKMIGMDLRGPSLEKAIISDITQTGAHVTAKILDIGGAEVKEKGFIYYYTISEYDSAIKVESTVEGNQIIVSLNNLSPGTKYYIYPYAGNGTGKGNFKYNYGERVSFTTLP